jgi:hypothetical protein
VNIFFDDVALDFFARRYHCTHGMHMGYRALGGSASAALRNEVRSRCAATQSDAGRTCSGRRSACTCS